MTETSHEYEKPPVGFEPQTPLQPGQQGGLTARPPDAIEDAEAEIPELQPGDDDADGVADDNDDTVEEDPQPD